MTIAFRCGQCGQLLRVPDQSAGKNARCPKCNALMQVPPAPLQAPGGYAPAPGNYVPVPGPMPQQPGFPGQPAMPNFPGQPGPVYPGPQPMPGQFGPAAPAPASNDKFAFLNPGGGQPAPQPNPFADPTGGTPSFGANPGAAPSLNPYAAPAYAAHTPTQRGARPGLPWEKKPSFKSWWDTMMLVLGSPTRAFQIMKRTGGLGVPIMFAIFGLGVPVVVALCIIIPVVIALGVGAGNQQGAGYLVGIGIGTLAFAVIAAIVYVFLVATIGALIAAAIYHLCLMIVGGAKHSFETTFRVVSFIQGAQAPVGILLGLIPYLGPLIQMVWMVALLITGLSKAHEISSGKAAAAVLLPYGVCLGLGALIFLVALGGILSAN